jgi:uncharacterized protein
MECTGFDWDAGNAKNNEKHGVSSAEVEQVFLNTPLLLAPDVKHSQGEPRLHALARQIKIVGSMSPLPNEETAS